MNHDRRRIAATLLGLPFAAPALLGQGRASGSGRLDPDRIGVNTHLGQGEAPERVAEALHYLGVRHIRDGLPGYSNLPRYLKALNGSVKLTALVGAKRPIPITITALEALERAQPGSVGAVEGPNEINNFPVNYTGRVGVDAALAFQNDLYDAVHASPLLSHVPVIAFTDIKFHETKADYYNFHPYPPGHTSLAPRLPSMLQKVSQSGTPTKPIQLTEFGYSTAIVSGAEQADLIIAGLRDSMAAGIKRVFIYALSDFYPDRDPANPRPGNHFGLFDLHYRPKPAADVLAKLLKG